MREILFKAKRKDDEKWVEGYYQKRYDLLGNEEHLIFRALMRLQENHERSNNNL